MPDSTTNFGHPFPEMNDPVDIASDIQALAESVDTYQASGYLFSERVTYTADNTWTKADYPGIRAVKVFCVAGGGGGTGALATGGGESSGGGGGGGGNYVEGWLLEAALAATETITIGAGGAGSPGDSTSDVASNGEESSFGSLVIAKEGFGANLTMPSGTAVDTRGSGGSGNPTGNVGDLVILGETGGIARRFTGEILLPGNGGNSKFGRGGVATHFWDATGAPANGFGAGGAGAYNDASSTQTAGESGTAGLVIVDIYV